MTVSLTLPVPTAPLTTSDVESRVKAAADPATDPAMLEALAADRAVTVRAAVALNPAAPVAVETRLAADADARVRLLLARKLAAALPSLGTPELDAKRDEVLAVLTTLVRDEAVRIRTQIATVLAACPIVPRAIVLALARDPAAPVSEPILRLSPLLSADDLLALLADPPHARTSVSIAARANLPGSVVEAIAASTDDPAVLALLANPSATLREETLDRLVARADGRADWHGALVRRSTLPASAARALSEILTGQLLGELAARSDLPASVFDQLRRRLASPPTAPEPGDEYMAEARRLQAAGALTEVRLREALATGDCRRAAALLAVAATIPLASVERAIGRRDAKALVSLVWKAGFPPDLAAPVQSTLGHVAPDAVLTSIAPHSFPLSHHAMAWQIDFLNQPS